MLDIATFILDKNRLKQCLDELIVIEKDTSSKLGKSSYGSYWKAENFNYDLPGKWDYSSIAYINNEVVGYLIVSSWLNNLHGHRMAMPIHLEGKTKVHIAKALYAQTAIPARENNCNYITAIVPEGNLSTQKYYLREGFEMMNNTNLMWFIEGRKFDGYISDNILVDNEPVEGEPSRSYVFRYRY